MFDFHRFSHHQELPVDKLNLNSTLTPDDDRDRWSKIKQIVSVSHDNDIPSRPTVTIFYRRRAFPILIITPYFQKTPSSFWSYGISRMNRKSCENWKTKVIRKEEEELQSTETEQSIVTETPILP